MKYKVIATPTGQALEAVNPYIKTDDKYSEYKQFKAKHPSIPCEGFTIWQEVSESEIKYQWQWSDSLTGIWLDNDDAQFYASRMINVYTRIIARPKNVLVINEADSQPIKGEHKTVSEKPFGQSGSPEVAAAVEYSEHLESNENIIVKMRELNICHTSFLAGAEWYKNLPTSTPRTYTEDEVVEIIKQVIKDIHIHDVETYEGSTAYGYDLAVENLRAKKNKINPLTYLNNGK